MGFFEFTHRYSLAGIVLALVTLCQSSHVLAQETDTTAPAVNDIATTAGAPQSETTESTSTEWVTGLDLSQGAWYASADLPPDTLPDRIAELGQKTSATVTLRSAGHGVPGMLFRIFDLPDPLPENRNGRITIGDIDGEDETFVNGQLVGSTRGAGVYNKGRPRAYEIPANALRPGYNVLALKLNGPGGRTTFGLRTKLITFDFTEPASSREGMPTGLGVSGLPENQARAAILRADNSVSDTESLQRKRQAFGRFGEFLHDGLPAVTEASPTRLYLRKGPIFSLSLDHVEACTPILSDLEPGIDGWHKLVHVKAQCIGKPVEYDWFHSSLYPGGIITLQKGNVLQFRIAFPGRARTVLPFHEEDLALAGIPATARKDVSAYLFFDSVSASCPGLMIATGLAVNITQLGDYVDVTVAVNGAKGNNAGKVFLLYPAGIRTLDLSSKAVSVRAIATAMNPGMDVAQTMHRWFRIALNQPAAVDEFFRVLDNDSTIRIYQVARYTRPAGFDNFDPCLVRPPQLDYAIHHFKYPISGTPTTATGVLTFSGEMHAAVPSPQEPPSEPAEIKVFWYDLPVPPLEERGLIAVPGQKELKDALGQWVMSDLGSTSSLTAVDAIYKSRTQAFQAFSYLSPDQKAKLLANSAEVIPAALHGHFWMDHEEPLSGLKYWWTYFIEGPYFQKFDQDWGNGLSLYGLYTYIKYSGDWRLAGENWESIERIFAWFSVTDDWEWMRASNGAHGHGTGAGDCENTAYAAALSYAKLARGCNRMPEYQYGLYASARAAVFMLNRFSYTEFARSTGFAGQDDYIVGFHEGLVFLNGELNAYPWNITSVISFNGIQPENFTFLLKYAPETLRAYEHVFEKSYPRWAEGDFKYPFSTLYKNNSG
jgi:hypothetical protein